GRRQSVAQGRAAPRRAGSPRPETDAARLWLTDQEPDEDSHEVWRGATEIQLTPTEFKLLRYLLVNARRVVSKAQILDHVWAYDFGGDASVVETYISYLRKKVDRSGPPLIHTVRGFGYALRLPPEEVRR